MNWSKAALVVGMTMRARLGGAGGLRRRQGRGGRDHLWRLLLVLPRRAIAQHQRRRDLRSPAAASRGSRSLLSTRCSTASGRCRPGAACSNRSRSRRSGPIFGQPSTARGRPWNSASSIISTGTAAALADYYESRLKLVEAYDRAASTPIISPSIIRRRSAWRPRRACFCPPSRSARAAAVRPAGLRAAAAPSAAADRGNLHARSDERRPARVRLRPRLGRRSRLAITAPIRPRRQEMYAEAVEVLLRGAHPQGARFRRKRVLASATCRWRSSRCRSRIRRSGTACTPRKRRAGGAAQPQRGEPRPAGRDAALDRALPRDLAAGARRRPCRSPSSASAASSWWRRPTPRRWRWRAAPIRSGTQASTHLFRLHGRSQMHPRPATYRSPGRARPRDRRLAADGDDFSAVAARRNRLQLRGRAARLRRSDARRMPAIDRPVRRRGHACICVRRTTTTGDQEPSSVAAQVRR